MPATLAIRHPLGVASLLGIALFSTFSYAAQQAGADAAVTDEIVITGQRSILYLRKQVTDAEDLMYDIFNKLNTNDAFDIHCFRETRLESHIKEKRCMPQYALDAMEDEAQALFGWIRGPEVSAVLNTYNPEMEEKLKAAVQDNSEFFQAVVRHHELREQLDSWRDRYFEGKE